GADHGGYKLKEALKKYLSKNGYLVEDFGAMNDEPSDYPVVAQRVAKAVSTGKFKKAILICKSGIGMAIVANKLRNVRSAVCNTTKQAKSSREHNDTNVLSLASEYINYDKAKKITKLWLTTKALGSRHKRRVNQIKKMEK
ncbi:MAG: RpiB/LacA/LacB family sugar-phosphate isomerase, partial [Candidatus Omnitrophota bacterium]